MSNPSSLTPPASDSRSSSPSGGEAKPRAVSGSLKDRIARFNNPSATPLVPTHPFGLAGPPSQPSSIASRGLVGNRIPSLDQKSSGLLSGGQGQRKVSENRGLIGNRIPSGVAPSTSIGKIGSGRSASPAGSVDSSTASGAAGSSNSPLTSRSSSPPTSPGGELPSSLLGASLPDTGGPGAMTPSSTRAEAGESVTDFSVPGTPVQHPTPTTAGHYDLSTPNLNLLASDTSAKNALLRGVSTQSNAASNLGSSRASQYASSATGDNQQQMMEAVSGVSTPRSTPKPEDYKDLEGSARGEGSIRGEGSVRGDEQEEMQAEDLGRRLEGLGLQVPGRDPTPEPPKETSGTAPSTENVTGIPDEGFKSDLTPLPATEDRDFPGPQTSTGALGTAKDETDPTPLAGTEEPSLGPSETVEDVAGQIPDEDPNQASDLAALKAGELETTKSPSGTHTLDQNPVNNMAEASIAQGIDEQPIHPSERKHQGGVAGQRMEDIEKPTAIEAPKTGSDEKISVDDQDDLDIHTATAASQDDLTETAAALPDVVQGKGAAGVRLDDAEKEGSGPMASGQTDQLKEALAEQRMEKADREDIKAADGLQTDEDRDEGAPRREQIIKAMDQNKEIGTDLEQGLDDVTKQKIRDVTSAITGEQRKAGESEMDIEEKLTKEVEQQKDGGGNSENTADKAEGVSQSQENEKDIDVEDISPGEGTSRGDGTNEAELTNPEVLEKKPLQVQIEPAPIAQPADTNDIEANGSSSADILKQLSTEGGEFSTPNTPPSFPEPPHDDPASVSQTPAEPADLPSSTATTPIDPTFLKSFPDVPDEEKPRVEVHVSHSPLSTPVKGPSSPNTPLAKIPGRSQSLSHPNLSIGDTEERDKRRDSLDVNATPTAAQNEKTKRRTSTRRSPKSPLLDDEDPGDFEAGEGWAIVTKGRDS